MSEGLVSVATTVAVADDGAVAAAADVDEAADAPVPVAAATIVLRALERSVFRPASGEGGVVPDIFYLSTRAGLACQRTHTRNNTSRKEGPLAGNVAASRRREGTRHDTVSMSLPAVIFICDDNKTTCRKSFLNTKQWLSFFFLRKGK